MIHCAVTKAGTLVTLCGVLFCFHEDLLTFLDSAHRTPSSVVDRVRLFDLAPPQLLTLQNFIAVLQDLMCDASEAGEQSDLNRALFKLKLHPPPSDSTSTSHRLPAAQLFPHFRLKEASGIPLLCGAIISKETR